MSACQIQFLIDILRSFVARSFHKECAASLVLQPLEQEKTLEQARTIRRGYWSEEQWKNLITSVVDDTFGTAERDEATDVASMNPTRLNSANRTRWLCDQMVRSNKRMDEMAEQQEAVEAKVDKRMDEIMEKLDKLLTQ